MTADAPVRIQLRRTKGWRKPEGAVVVSRPSRWGNPFRAVRRDCPTQLGSICWCVVQRDDNIVTRHLNSEQDARREAVRLYVRSIADDPLRLAWASMVAVELRGSDLACWCPLDQPCHADVLLDIANGGAA